MIGWVILDFSNGIGLIRIRTMVEDNSSKRVPAKRDIYVIYPDGRTEFGKMLSISQVSAEIRMVDPKKIGEKLQVAFRLIRGAEYDEFLCFVKVYSCRVVQDRFTLELQFLQMPPPQKQALSIYIKSKKH